MKAAMLSITKYMAKLEGKYEILAWKKPGEVAVIIMKMIATRGFNSWLTFRNRRVSHAAHASAKNPRRT
jgi:hypothetical protein